MFLLTLLDGMSRISLRLNPPGFIKAEGYAERMAAVAAFKQTSYILAFVFGCAFALKSKLVFPSGRTSSARKLLAYGITGAGIWYGTATALTEIVPGLELHPPYAWSVGYGIGFCLIVAGGVSWLDDRLSSSS